MYILSLTLSLAFVLLFWRLSRANHLTLPLFFFAVIASMLVIVINRPSLWLALHHGYEKDSFFTLGLFGRVGVLAISSFAIALFFALLAFKTRFFLIRHDRGLVGRLIVLLIDCLAGLIIFGVLYSVSPQIYYSFYQLIIPDLPNQIVIKSFFNIERLQDIARLKSEGSLSHHLAGVTFLATLPFTFWLHGRAASWRQESIVLMVAALLVLQMMSLF